MNYLWGIMMLVGIAYGGLTGNLAEVTEAALSSAKEAISLCITMAGVMAFWVGIMEIAEAGGMIKRAANGLGPVISFLFPRIKKEHPARKPIATNMIANILGLGWAATPAGLEAMKALSVEKKVPEDVASDEMCDFLILNISSLQLIPVSIIAYRSQYGSVHPTRIVGPAMIATALSTLAAVLFIKIHHILRK